MDLPHISYPTATDGLQYTKPADRWDEAFPLGNGLLGALIWGDGKPLRISLDRTDLWDLRPVPEFHSSDYTYKKMVEWHRAGKHADLVRLYEAPYERPAPTKIPAGRLELTLPGEFREAKLELLEATAFLQFHQAMARLFVHATQPVGMMQLMARGEPDLRLAAPPFGGRVEEKASGGISAGDLAQLGYPAPEESQGERWRAFQQQGWQGFRFAVYTAWTEREGAWEIAWSVASSFEGTDPLKIAKERVDQALKQGYETLLTSHGKWWRAFWAQASVNVPNQTLQRGWFQEVYKFGSASRKGAPPITLQGPWTADDGKLPPWKGDYHHDLNTQLSYWLCYSGNRLNEGLAFLDWLWSTRSHCESWTRRFFEMPGLNVPMTADLNNNQIGGWRQYTHSPTTAAWLAHHFYLHWRYSMDRQFLRDRAYPYIRDSVIFIEAVTQERDARGKRALALSSSPEINDNRPEAWFDNLTNYDLALIRWLVGAALELAGELKRSADAQRWRKLLSELPDFALDREGDLLVAEGYPLKESHRHFSHLMAIHPLGLIDRQEGESAQRTINASLKTLDRLKSDYWTGYSFAWLASLAARAGEGERAAQALEIFWQAFVLRNGFHCNGDQSGKGYSKFTYRPFTLEGNFAAAQGLQEMLLQSQRGVIQIFPAIPKEWDTVGFTTLRAEGAFLVSALKKQGKMQWVQVRSEQGGTCRIMSPFTGKLETHTMKRGQSLVLRPK
ncbi:MAG: glycoside hydrolase N-terminal domain-containing protein [Fimbriimonadia bacterium]|nr:glycoside hydrolase N-terminal domain-containing protein [Fimbriimonadia bacterium]